MAHQSRCRGFVVAVSACVAVAVVCSGRWASAESAAEKKIREELAKPTQVEFNETPLRDVIKYFIDAHGINIEVNQPKLEEVSVTMDKPITRVLKGVTLGSSLKLMLEPIGVTYVIENEVLLITSPENAQRSSMPRTHDVSGLGGEGDREALIKAVELVLDAPAKEDGKPLPLTSRLRIFRDKLILRGSQPEHDRVDELLQRLREEAPRATAVQRAPPPAAEDATFGNEAILESISRDIRRMPVADRKFARYFSIAHRLNAGASKEELAVEREALAKAINHLSWQAELVRPIAIETTQTVLRIDIRKLGWDKQPFRQVKNGKFVANSKLNLFDLALLEYPYGVVSHKSETYRTLAEEFLNHANQARPIAYVRADWFVSTVTQPPLYEDFLQLPRTIKELETLLGVDSAANVANSKAVRAGMLQSGVSRNNRVVERHEGKYGAYWKTFDFQSSQGSDNIFSDPINLKPAGGEVIFTLPNGLQAYYITNGKGERIDSASTAVVTDANASDKTVRNGLSCMRCHERGMIAFADVVRPTLQKLRGASAEGMNAEAVLKLYPEQSKLDALLKQDEEKFMNSMEQLLGKPQTVEPLKPVSKEFLDLPLSLSQAGAEIGLSNSKQFKNDAQWKQKLLDFGFSALLAGKYVPRDAWEGQFERLVRELRLGIPLAPLDGLTVAEYSPSAKAPFDVEIKTNQTGNIFKANEEIVIFVKPSKDVFIELIGTSARGRKVVLAPATTKVKAGVQFRFPPEGKSLKAKGGAGNEQITVFASQVAFGDGELLRGDGVSDRVVHAFQLRSQGQQVELQCSPNPLQGVKKTISIEAR